MSEKFVETFDVLFESFLKDVKGLGDIPEIVQEWIRKVGEFFFQTDRLR
jgi:hypothetical protein